MSDAKFEIDVIGPPCVKKIKKEDKNVDPMTDCEYQLEDFIPRKILCNNTNRKTVSVLGNFKDKSGSAIVSLEKNAFKEKDLDNNGYFSAESSLKNIFVNDIYGNFLCFAKQSLNGMKTTIIHPATEKHIQRLSQQEVHVVLESPECYEKLTRPQIAKDQFNIQWVFNILDGKSEVDKILYDNKCEKEGFVLLPDLKWDGLNIDTLYLLAIVRQRGIKSLRDLDAAHLPLLRTVRDKGKKVILEKYKVLGSQLRVYIHYQPSFYHLHIHFTYLKHEGPGIFAEKSHLLDTVINNIEMMSDYYKKATIPFTIREMDSLFDVYETNGYVQKIKSENTNK